MLSCTWLTISIYQKIENQMQITRRIQSMFVGKNIYKIYRLVYTTCLMANNKYWSIYDVQNLVQQFKFLLISVFS